MTAALQMTSAKWLIGELPGHGLSVSAEPGNSQSQSSSSTFVISFRPDNEQEGKTWIGIVERNCGFLDSLLGGRARRIAPPAVAVIHKILSGSPNVEELQWHFRRDFDQGREELGASSP